MKEILEVIVLGIVQGATEFIPVSSSGHLILVGEVFSFGSSSFALDAILNIGTLSALIVYFRKRLHKILVDLFSGDIKLLGQLVIATVPAVIVGYFLQDIIESTLRSSYIVAFMLISVGVVMILMQKFSVAKPKKVDDMTNWSAIKIGFFQVLAFIPGTSRSASTIIGARLQGLSHQAAAEFSFLLAIPVFTGALLKLSLDGTFADIDLAAGVVAIGIISSFVSGILAIRFMLVFLSKHGLGAFGVYRIFVGCLLLLWLAKGA